MNAFFEAPGYKIVRNAYDVTNHRTGLADLFFYCRFLPDSDDDQNSPNSPAYYGDIEISKVLIRLMPLIASEVGLEFYPTYPYMRRHGSRGVLPRHKDREACEISCKLCIGHDSDYSWPIWVEDRMGNEHEVTQRPGDLLIYRGTDQPHWREPAVERVTCQTQAFLHDVDQNGPCQNEIFDQTQEENAFTTLATKAENLVR